MNKRNSQFTLKKYAFLDLLFTLFAESLLAGVYQDVTAKLHTGSSVIEAGSKISLIPSHSCLFLNQTYVVGTQKNRLNETVLLSTQNICLI